MVRFVGVVARPIRLTSKIGGVVVDFVGGFEHPKREHFVVAAIGDELVEAWHEKDGPGPTWSSTAIIRVSAGQQGMVFFHGAHEASGSDDSPDVLDARLLTWSEKQKTMVPQRLAGRMFAVLLGRGGDEDPRIARRVCRRL